MKKTLIYALALALALSLAACGQPTDPAPGTSTPEPIAAPEPTKDTTPKTTEGAQPPEDGQALEELNHDELIAVFGPVYDASKEVNNSDSEETIQNELLMIEMTAASMSKSLPSDYETRYREWRPSVISQAPEDTLTKPVSQSSSKPSGGGTSSTGGSQQTQGGATIIIDDTEGLNIVNGSDLNKQMIEDAKDLDTGIDDPYASYGKVTIGYGGDVSNSNSGGINKYTPGGIVIAEED